jgi:flagellar basal body P-ring formation protein FlgA
MPDMRASAPPAAKRHRTDAGAWHAPCCHRRMMRILIFGVAATLAALTRSTGAVDLIDPALISAAALDAVRVLAGPAASGLILQPAPVDARLRVAACDRPLKGFITGDGKLLHQTTVGVRCEGAIRWTIYTSVSVESQTAVLVARRPLSRDTELGAADFQLETHRVPGVASAYVTDNAALSGQRLHQPLAAGEALQYSALAPANLVHRGQHVVLLARAGGVEVRMEGVALADGGVSDRIRVENLSSQRIIEGIVRSESVVETPL